MGESVVEVKGEKLLTVQQAATATGLSVATLHADILATHLRAIQVGKASPQGRCDLTAEPTGNHQRKSRPAMYLILESELARYVANRRARKSDSPVNRGSVNAVGELAARLRPRTNFPREDAFGERFWKDERDKRLIAARVALELIPEGSCLEGPRMFFGDGSSALWTAIACFTTGKRMTILTNNYWLPGEIPPNLRDRVLVSLIPGIYHYDRGALFGSVSEPASQTVRACAEAAQNAHCSILPVTVLTFHLGPQAAEPAAREIKQAVIPSARVLVLIAEATKLVPSRTHKETAPVYPQPEDWHRLRDRHCDRKTMRLVCTNPPADSAEWTPKQRDEFEKEVGKFEDRLGKEYVYRVDAIPIDTSLPLRVAAGPTRT